jgi:hypothetical protein
VKWVAGGVLFAVLATANAAGYRYGSSDQAFYIPAVARAIDPGAFPRDASLIDAQGRLMLADELIAAVAVVSDAPLDLLFFIAYLLSLGLLWAGLVLIGRSTYATPWLTVALGAAFTLRHRIPRTSANSFEPYFHPRMFAFALGALAIASVMRRRSWPAVALVAVAAVVHVTTAMWFGVVIGIALALTGARWRRLAIAGAAAAAAVAIWALAAGPLRASLAAMDDVWLSAVAGKDSLFATEWPAWAWAANLALLPVLWWAHRRRQAHGIGQPHDRALVWGATGLVALFLVTLPAVAARLALPVQLQLPRVFWLVDLLATIYVIGAVTRRRTAVILASALVAASVARGVYVMTVEYPERDLFALHLADSPWEEAMGWLHRQRADVHVLADPGHAWRYGTSVRVSAARDVFLEDVKDSAVAIYSRDVALRYLERSEAVAGFAELSAGDAQRLAARYGLDFLVTEADLPLPVAYRNTQFRIYELRERTERAEGTGARGARSKERP